MFKSIISISDTIIAIIGCLLLMVVFHVFIRLTLHKKKILNNNIIKKIFFYDIKNIIHSSLFIINYISMILLFVLVVNGIINIVIQQYITSLILYVTGSIYFTSVFIQGVITIKHFKSSK